MLQESEHSDQVHAQQLDSYYANLVKGAMVNTSMSIVWGASNETEHSTHDEEMFSSILWNTLLKVMDSEAIKRGVNNDQHILSTVARVKHIKAAMKDIWEQSKLYRITNEVRCLPRTVCKG